VTVGVPPDISILEALEWVGVFARGLVWEGICGMCETGMLDGTPEHRDYVLAPLDGENMMICCSRSLRLVLDLCWSATA
jgi:hypothetical protein